MASSILLSDNGVSSGSAGVKTAGGNDGTLLLQTTTSGGTATTAVTIDNAQKVTFAYPPTATGAGGVSTNTAYGTSALAANTSGAYNTAVGNTAMTSNTTGQQNAVFGDNAFYTNTTGSYNSAFGRGSLNANTTGGNNTALGYFALVSNTTASNNTAVGYQAGYSNTTGGSNNALGKQALYSMTTNSGSTAMGDSALLNTTGGFNTAFGYNAGYLITTGAKNTVLGSYSGNQSGLDIRTSSNYIVLSDGDGNPRGYFVSSGIFVAPATYTNTSANAANCYVGTDGSFVRSTSALKYKQDIRDIEEININLLRGVRYKSKCEGDDQTKDHFGIIADEADAAGLKELVHYNADGEVEGFQYERLTVVLLKSLQTIKADLDATKAELATLKGTK
jgi:hypothetical protein